jgi:carbon monoxide dehydrogenase subunit G
LSFACGSQVEGLPFAAEERFVADQNGEVTSMQMSGERRIPAPREEVWKALNDPEVLRQAIPGCQSLDKEGDNSFTAKVKAKVGPVSATFAGAVTLSDINPPESYRLSGEGKGGAAGFAKGGAKVVLEDDGQGTLLKYDVDAKVGGKLAQIGSRLVDGTAKKLSEEFFDNFSNIVAGAPSQAPEASGGVEEPVVQEAPAVAEAPTVEAPTPPTVEQPARKGLSPLVWIGGLVAIVILLIYFFAGR